MKIFLVVLLAIAIGGCWKSEPPTSIKGIDQRITSVTTKNTGAMSVLVIELGPEDNLTNSMIFSSAADDMEDISYKLVKYSMLGNYDQVDYVLDANVEDEYGKQSIAPVINIDLLTDDLKKIDFRNFTSWQLLNLTVGGGYRDLAGKQLLESYCSSGDNAKYANDFCATFPNAFVFPMPSSAASSVSTTSHASSPAVTPSTPETQEGGNQQAQKLEALTSSAIALTGDITLSATRITLQSGSYVAIRRVADGDVQDSSGKLVHAEIFSLPDGKSVASVNSGAFWCGKIPAYIAISDVTQFDTAIKRSRSIFVYGGKSPLQGGSMCAGYAYEVTSP